MSANHSDLLARVQAYEAKHEPDEPKPTRLEAEIALEDLLEELESTFPDGEPSTTWQRLDYQMLRLRVQTAVGVLEEGDFSPEPRPCFSAIQGGRDT